METHKFGNLVCSYITLREELISVFHHLNDKTSKIYKRLNQAKMMEKLTDSNSR